MSYASNLISENYLWEAVSGAMMRMKTRRSSSNFISINCPLCVSRGETPDTRYRCGVTNNTPGLGIHCFNCGVKARWSPGQPIGRTMRDFLLGIGISDIDVKRLSYKAAQIARMVQSSPEAQALVELDLTPTFRNSSLPPRSQSLEAWAAKGCDDPDFLAVAEYLFSRGDVIASAMNYFWTPNTDDGMNRRLIIPFYHHGMIVGYTGRAIEPGPKKYHSDLPSDFLFNNYVMGLRDRRIIVLLEGVLDAVAVDGVATLGARLNDRQAAWIDSIGKKVIVVPDRDKSGQRLIDVAIARNWHVAFPALGGSNATHNWWEADVKDAAAASKRYGRLYTLTSIIKSATGNRMEIDMKRKLLQ